VSRATALRHWHDVHGAPFAPSDEAEVAPSTDPGPCTAPCGWCTSAAPCEARRQGEARAVR